MGEEEGLISVVIDLEEDSFFSPVSQSACGRINQFVRVGYEALQSHYTNPSNTVFPEFLDGNWYSSDSFTESEY